MSDHRTYKIIEVVGSSTQGTDDAVRNAINECSKTIHHIDWFEVLETRGHVENGSVSHFQVVMKVGFRIAES